ncbi:hypothetical protein CVT24_005168 [Panaeolus cyanescens]|uniref:Uncharacterized protein n=1 Tax=Panaeolus cyanescens TaxID=181874 RepID=A0A409Y9D6_9AGAR|nr:hypothetical protein CVT24_005168 [Panaeolus cyanescens]
MKPHTLLPLVVASVVAKAPLSNVITNIQDGIAAWKANHRDISPSFFQQCPPSCFELGDDPVNWPTYASFDNLKSCTKSLSVSFPVYSSLDDSSLGIRIRACTKNSPSSFRTTAKPAASASSTASTNTEDHQEAAKIAVTGTASADAHDDIIAAAHSFTSTSSTIAFGSSRNVILGLYSGSNLKDGGVASSLLSRFIDYIEQGASLGDVMVVQLCGSKDRGSDFAFGIAVSTSGNITFVQSTVKQWSAGLCADTPSADAFRDWEDVTFKVPPLTTGLSDVTAGSLSRRSLLNVFQQRADCRTITVVSGDSCGSLASKCGVSATDFTTFNPQSNLCSTLAVGQRVCCSSGSLPDITPKPNSDGTCATYTTQSGDYCAAIAANFGLTTQNIEDFNKNTWNWNGCDKLQLAYTLCVSTGDPPMPAPITDAQCGPQVPGTTRPTGGAALADLNPCPLNACCNIWGFCGTTDDFCTEDKTNNPNYCISHCGRDFVKGSPPAQYIKVGYFEAFNFDRPCLNAYIDWVDWAGLGYTHVHYAFASINPSDFNVNVSAYSDQFEHFKALQGVKRILSFGGWSFSTDLSTYDVLRSALAEDNRIQFRDNVISFINTHGLDGVDFDWEYPGAPDIPGIPPGQQDDGINYLLFLLLVWAELPTEKSLSIAAPASYWYLRGFPAELMGAVVDYIVYMTYDLHGQWDYGSGWANPVIQFCF